MWKPREIIINRKVEHDPVTSRIRSLCTDIPTKFIDDSKSKTVVSASDILVGPETMLEKVLAGKQILHITSAGPAVDTFTMPDERMMCPEFERLKLASNGCFYQCDWCYLKLTYRAAFPFITVHTEYDKIQEQLRKRLAKTTEKVIFNSGELADSLAMEHLTGAAREFIPWFAQTENGYLYMLTKSDNVDDILDLGHNGHTIVAWSMNNSEVSRRFEIGAPTFERRLRAARKVQEAGYPVRIRIDPIVPGPGWREAYAETVEKIFDEVSPERVTLGTLRFEEGFYKMRNSIFSTREELRDMVEGMEPMFSPRSVPGRKRPAVGKYSFPASERVEIFQHLMGEIRKRSDCTIALCKEDRTIWEAVGLNLSRCSCVCQLDYVDMG